MNKSITLLAAISTLILASCGTDPGQAEEEALAKRFNPTPGRVNVFIYRPMIFGLGGNARPVNLDLDGKPADRAPEANQFSLLDIPAGQHTISAYGKNITGVKLGVSDYKFNANKGENVFLKMTPLFTVDVIVASTPVVSWARLSDAEGRSKITNSNLSMGIETIN
jgi:hypothetical protein